jgi:hypothetical protein
MPYSGSSLLKSNQKPFCCCGGLWSCGQRAALSKRLVGNGTLSSRRGKSISLAVTFFSPSGFIKKKRRRKASLARSRVKRRFIILKVLRILCGSNPLFINGLLDER